MFKLRVRYLKKGRLKYLSHLEVLRSVERIVRRAQLPYAISQGFSPRMRIAFSTASSVGLESYDEYFDVLLEEYLPPQEAGRRLMMAAPEDLMIQKAAYVPMKAPSLTAALSVHTYRIRLYTRQCSFEELKAACEEIERRGIVVTLKKHKVREVDIRDKLIEPVTLLALEGGFELTVVTRVQESGSLRIDGYVEMLARLLYAARYSELHFDAFGEEGLEQKMREKYFDRISYVRLAQEQEDEAHRRYTAFETLTVEE